MVKIRKILVANRGEIALRVMKTCREMGLRTVAVYSDIDKHAPHVRFADEAYLLGPAPARESYLNMPKVIEIAKKSRAQAIHPGYGFLSENPKFVGALDQNGILFIGPEAACIRTMGDKTSARQLADSIGIPIVPGTVRPLSSSEDALSVASKMTFPILLKASAGGGGKGMRIVHSESELASAFKSGQSEARSAFGDDRVYIEKYIERPRHIEVQILADTHGNVIHLGERECSIQRRHQKIIEESPSTIIDSKQRSLITHAATKLAKAGGYTSAGTIEFILDTDGHCYFLEVNTRLQVEHPVTEMRTGLDLVREQIQIAEGEHLSLRQEDVTFRGHSVECRIYAEDPLNNFFPSTGKVAFLRPPAGPNVREDRGIEEGDDITAYYDPLLSKLVTWGIKRSDALQRMQAALRQYEMFGVRNNLALCLWVVNHEKYQLGEFDTNFLQDHFRPDLLPKPTGDTLEAGALAAVLFNTMLPEQGGAGGETQNQTPKSKWKLQRSSFMRE